jgi:hypothetical protein
MRKGKIFFLALVIAAALIPYPFAGRPFAAGGASAIVPLKDAGKNLEKGTEPGERNLEKGKSGAELTTKEKEGKKIEKPSPVKKPRLKYRDPYECGC